MTHATAADWASPYSTPNARIAGRIDNRALTDGRAFDILNPANEAVIGQGLAASADQVAAALASSARAFDSWRFTPAQQRSAILHRTAAILRDKAQELARTLTLEQGKPLAQALVEIQLSAEALDWFAGAALRIDGRVMPGRTPGARQITQPEPIGPVAALTPWNFPALLAVRKIGPALAAGCTVVLKPAEETPAITVALADAFAMAALPAGVLNLVFGNAAEISSALIASPVIRKVSFTGSVPVGKLLAEQAGRHMKPCTLELGGHAPVLVMDDTDPIKAAATSVLGKSRNSGQVCTSPTRFFVQDAVHDRFLTAFADGLAALKVGDGTEPGVDMGPLANARRITAMEDLVADAVQRGATLVTGGSRIGNRGYLFQPTVLAGVPDDARIMSTEPFGPIAIVNRVATLDEALAKANSVPVGLAGYAFTDSHPRAVEISQRLEVGMLAINNFAVSQIEAPFGGVKDSGYGYEGGPEGLQHYLHYKLVHHA